MSGRANTDSNLYPQKEGTTLSINMTAKTVRLSILENKN